MIRRWSHINESNLLISPVNMFGLFKIKKKIKTYIFRKAVYYKKFKFKYSKFKRKPFMRLKHDTNLLVLVNVFKYWSTDYCFSKHLIKSYFMFNISEKNFLFYNYSFIKNKNENVFFNINFLFSAFSKRKYYLDTQRLNSSSFTSMAFFKNNNLSFCWLFENPIDAKEIVPTLSLWDSHYYDYYHNNEPITVAFDFDSLFNIFFLLAVLKHVELYKIIIFFFVNATLK